MVVRIYILSEFVFGDFILYLCRFVVNFGGGDGVDNFVLYLVVAAATNAGCGRAELLYVFGLSNKHQKLGRIIGNIGNFEQPFLVFEV